MMKLAPVALIAYNRSKTLLKTIESLKKNKLIKNTDIYIFCDGPRQNKEDRKKVLNVKNILSNLKGLKVKKKIFHQKNIGVKKNIIGAVNYVLKNNSKIIVVEDDLILSKSFLVYMNHALEFTKNKKNIWHVSGWNYPITKNLKYKNKVFIWNNMNCWGWGTHKKYWNRLVKNPNFFLKNFTEKDIQKFDLEGRLNNWSQLIKNKKKIITTWAIFWNATIFYNKSYCLNPVLSYTKNIGFDSNSTHTKKSLPQLKRLNTSVKMKFTTNQKKDIFFINKVKSYLSYENKSIFGLFKKKIYEFLND